MVLTQTRDALSSYLVVLEDSLGRFCFGLNMNYEIFVNLVDPLPDCNIGHRFQIIGVLHGKWQVLYEQKSGYYDRIMAREVGFQLLSEQWQVFQNEMKDLDKFYEGAPNG